MRLLLGIPLASFALVAYVLLLMYVNGRAWSNGYKRGEKDGYARGRAEEANWWFGVENEVAIRRKAMQREQERLWP